MMKKHPRYRKSVKEMSERAFLDLEKMFESKWSENETENQESQEKEK